MNPMTHSQISDPSPASAPAVPPLGFAALATSGKAITALVLGLLGLFIAGIPLGCVAVGLGISARDDIARGTRRGAGLAVAGIVLGVLDIVLMVLVLATIGV